VVRAEERLEADRLRPTDDRQLIGIGQALLGLDHQRESHRSPHVHQTITVSQTIALDAIFYRV
jgi:hypothetical protein